MTASNSPASPPDPSRRRLPMAPSDNAPLADLQNELLGDSKIDAHENAAHEKRNWVRLSYDCNNKCIFCLDSDAHNGTMRANDEIKVQIIQGRKKGAQRLILSGGEPTMHPNFLDFVLLGKRAGYPKVQTVTNGRMFQYPQFLQTAADNGLHEITFSLHGHTAKLHDGLVGTPGAFVEEVAGLKAALASQRFIINIDIVITKRNVKHLPVMLETFIGWGVKEFDLLHIIPFGNAWSEARDFLFYDLDGNLEYLQQAFAYARRPDVHIWLNRFPPPYAEGFEDLIQDPYKLNDEVRGRKDEFDRLVALGTKLSCRQPERCKHCYLETLCDGADVAIAATKAKEIDVVRVANDSLPARPSALANARVLSLVAEDVAKATAIAGSFGTNRADVELDLVDATGLAESITVDAASSRAKWAGRSLARCVARTAEAADALLAIDAPFDVAVHLSNETEAFVRAHAVSPRLVVLQPNYDRVTDARAHDVDTKAFFALPEIAAAPGLRVENVPACLSGRTPLPHRSTLDTEMVGSDGRLDMTRYTQRFVADGFYTKALRCKDCSQNATCRGVHVNWARAHGFAPLRPF